MTVDSAVPIKLIRWTKWYLLAWAVAFVVWRIGNVVPLWLLALVFVPSIAFGMAWLLRLKRDPVTSHKRWAVIATAIYPLWWQLAVFLSEWSGVAELRQGLTTFGMFGIFLIGLSWIIWWVERSS